MLDKILLYIVSTISFALVVYGLIAHTKLKLQEVKIHNMQIDLVQAQRDIKLKSFEAKHDEKKDNTNEEINTTLSDVSIVPDGNYSGV